MREENTKIKEAIPVEEVKQTCGECGEVCTQADMDQIKRVWYCRECTHICDDCGDRVLETHSVADRDRQVCHDCEENYRECEVCASTFHEHNEDWYGEGICYSCYTDRGGREADSATDYPILAKFISLKTTGNILKSCRMFGTELECGTYDDDGISKAQKAVPIEIIFGDDGSIHGVGNDTEIKTPPCSGMRGEAMIENLCKILDKYEFEANYSCGYHLHVDCKDIADDLEKAKLLWMTYLTFDDVLMSFLPQSRRVNSYCSPLKNKYNLESIEGCVDQNELTKLWYKESAIETAKRRANDWKDYSRKHGVNLHMLFHAKRVEIRYHSGTTQAERILEWANLHCLIIDAVKNGNFDYSSLYRTNVKVSIAEKTKYLFAAIGLAEGSQEYFQARQKKFESETKWPVTHTFNAKVEALSTHQEE